MKKLFIDELGFPRMWVLIPGVCIGAGILIFILISIGDYYYRSTYKEKHSDKASIPYYGVEPKDSKRFTVNNVCTFEDTESYYGRHTIFLITDQTTGKEFLGISGVGVTEMGSHSSGKTTKVDER